MTQLVAWAVAGSFGLWLLMRGFLPPRPALSEILTLADEPTVDGVEGLRSVYSKVGLWLINAVQRDKLEETLKPDLAVNQVSLEDFARDKLSAALGGAIVAAMVCALMGWVDTWRGLIFVALAGACAGFILPDMEMSQKAAARRVEFDESLTAFVSLVAVCLSGGGGVNSAMTDALSVGSPWPFQMLRAALGEANIHGQSYWKAFDQLGRRLKVEALIELAGALGLAGDSGAKVADTLQSRAEASREKERQTVLAEAHKRSERLNFPIAALALTWMAFIMYPSVQNLLRS